MQAGKELNRVVAVHIFGRDEPIIWQPYSTDLLAAWRVVEELNRSGWSLRLVAADSGQMAACFHHIQGAQYLLGARMDDAAIAIRETPAHAICLAALAACGVEVPA